MQQAFKLTQDMDLIKIHKEGNFEQFKNQYLTYKKALEEFKAIKTVVMERYFPEIYFGQVDTSKISLKEYKKLPSKEQIKYIITDGSEERKHMYEDKNVLKLLQLMPNFTTKVDIPECDDPSEEYFDAWDEIQDPNGIKFAKQIANREIVENDYSTIIEEAEAYGEQEVIDFIKENPIESYKLFGLYHKRFSNKIIKIREDLNLSVDEFAEKLNIKPKIILRMENENYLGEKAIAAYCNFLGIKEKEFLEYDCLIDWVKEMRKHFKDSKRYEAFIASLNENAKENR